MSNLPFVWSIFWKVFVGVTLAIVATFYGFMSFTEYERTVTDTVGASISGLIFCYLLHLWLLPAEYLGDDEAYYDDDEEYDDEEGNDEGGSSEDE